MNIDSLKSMCSILLPDLRIACIEYIAAKALEDSIKEIAKEICNKVLMENEYYVSQEKADEINAAANERIQEIERITDEFDTYLMSAEDFQDYMEKRYKYYLEAGIDDPRGINYLPEAEPKHKRFAAEKKVLDIMQKITASIISADDYKLAVRNCKYKDRLLQIAIGLAALNKQEINI